MLGPERLFVHDDPPHFSPPPPPRQRRAAVRDRLASDPSTSLAPAPFTATSIATTTHLTFASPDSQATSNSRKASGGGACVSCRRSKHACRPSETPGETRCARCEKRDEKCEFRRRFHEEEWQAWAQARIKELIDDAREQQQQIQHLTTRVEVLEAQLRLAKNGGGFDWRPTESAAAIGFDLARYSISGSSSGGSAGSHANAARMEVMSAGVHSAVYPHDGKHSNSGSGIHVSVSPLNVFPTPFMASHPAPTLAVPSKIVTPGPASRADHNKEAADRQDARKRRRTVSPLPPPPADPPALASTALTLKQQRPAPSIATDVSALRSSASSESPDLTTTTTTPTSSSASTADGSTSSERTVRALSQSSRTSLLDLTKSESKLPLPASPDIKTTTPLAASPATSLSRIVNPSRDCSPSHPATKPLIILGCRDTRPNVCTKQLIPQKAAKELFEYFHKHLAPQLYGWQFMPGRYPYARDTERTITPYILAATLFVSAQRLPEYHHLVPILAQELPIASPMVPHVEPDKREREEREERERLLLTDNFPSLNVELGIGPEEITAAAVLSFFDQGQDATLLSKRALHWTHALYSNVAKQDKTFVIGEALGWLSETRPHPSYADMCRVRLFTFVNAVHCAVANGDRPPLINVEEDLIHVRDTNDKCSDDDTPIDDRRLVREARLAQVVQLAYILGVEIRNANGLISVVVDDRCRHLLDEWLEAAQDLLQVNGSIGVVARVIGSGVMVMRLAGASHSAIRDLLIPRIHQTIDLIEKEGVAFFSSNTMQALMQGYRFIHEQVKLYDGANITSAAGHALRLIARQLHPHTPGLDAIGQLQIVY